MNPADPAAPPTKLSGGPVCGDPLERSRRGWLLAPILTAADGRAAAFRDALQLGTGAGGADVGHLRTDTLAAVGRFEPFGVLYNQTTDDRDGDDAARAASHLQTVATLGWTGAVVWRTLYPDGTVEFRFLARPAAERRTRPAARPPAPARLAATVDDADPRLALVREALAVATDPAAARYRYHPVRLHDLDGESPGRAPGDAAPRRTAPLRRADSLPADGTAGPTVYWGISAAFAALAPPSFVPAAHPAGAGFPAPPAGARVFLPRDLHAVFGPVKPGGTLYHVVHSLARPATDGPPAIAAPDTAFALRDPQRLAEPGGAEVEIVEAKYRPAELGTAPPRPLPGQKVFDVKWVERTAPYDVDSDRLPLWDPATDQPFIRLTNVEPLTYELPANRRVVATLSVVGDRVLESPQFVRMSTDAPGRVQPSAGAEVVAEVPDPGRHPRIYFVTRQANLTVPVAAVDGQGRPTGDTFAPLLRLRWTDRDGRKEDEYLLAAVLRASPVDGGVSGYYVWEFDPEGALRPDVWGTVTDVGLVWKHDSGDNDPGDTFRLSPWNEVDPYVVPFRKALPGLRPQVSLVADLAGQSPGYTHLLAYGTGAGGGPHRPRLARAAGAVRFDLTAEQAQEVEAAFPDPSGGEEVVVHVIKTLGLGEVIGHLKAATPSSAVRQGRAAPVPPKSGAPTTRRPNGRRP